MQRVILKLDHTQQAFEVTCTFLKGSKAQGCFFTLNGTFGSYTEYVMRRNASASHRYQVNGSLEMLNYSVFDWEEDGTVGGVALPVALVSASLPKRGMVYNYNFL